MSAGRKKGLSLNELLSILAMTGTNCSWLSPARKGQGQFRRTILVAVGWWVQMGWAHAVEEALLRMHTLSSEVGS